jgi:hypothetical protein
VDKRELRDRGPQMRHDDADPDQPPVHERTERDPTRVDVVLEFVPLCLDGSVRRAHLDPRPTRSSSRAAPPAPSHAVIEEIDVLSPIDLTDARKLRASQPPNLDAFGHHATIARRSSHLAPRPRCTHTPDPNSHERAITVVIGAVSS